MAGNIIQSSNDLKQQIAALELLQKEQWAGIKGNAQRMKESVRPVNLVKAGLQSISETPVLRQNLINAVISLATGWVTRKLAVPKNDTIVKRAVGAAVQYGVSHLLATNGDPLKDVVNQFSRNFRLKKKRKVV